MQLRLACSAAGVPLVFDEVYTGFRLAAGGAQEYLGVRADMVVYGKTVAGGFPVGVVCGRRDLMQRFDPRRPMRLAYVVGTFSAHPAVMGAMYKFLTWVTAPTRETQYLAMNRQCAEWARLRTCALADEALPVRVVHLGTIWTVLFTEPGRYNWLLQYYLRAEGVTLSWVGTGRCLSSMDFTAQDYAELRRALVSAVSRMKSDGWWLDARDHPEKEKRMKSRLVQEMVKSLVPVPPRGVLPGSHAAKERRSPRVTQRLRQPDASPRELERVHLLLRHPRIRSHGRDVPRAGGALRPPVRTCRAGAGRPHEKEMSLLGYTTRNKTLIVLGYTLIPFATLFEAGSLSIGSFVQHLPTIAEYWWYWTLFAIFARIVYLIWKFSFRTSMIWYVKLVTDPLTDIIAYFPRRQRA